MVYLIKAEGMKVYKIGHSSDVVLRLYNLKGSSPVELDLVKSWNIPTYFEMLLHEKLNEYRKHGEWFNLPDSVANKLKRCDSTKDIVEAFELDKLHGYVKPFDYLGIPL